MDAVINTLNAVYTPPKCDLFDLEPEQVHVIFRHGDRSPSPINSVNLDANLWASRLQEPFIQMLEKTKYKIQTHPWGQLTTTGKEQALGLGQWLRRSYLDVLKISAENLPSSIQFRSTDYERAHMTGLYVLNGLLGSSEAAGRIPVIMRENTDETFGDNGYFYGVLGLVKESMDLELKPVLQADGTFRPSDTSLLFEKLQAGLGAFLGLPTDRPFNWLLLTLVVDAIECGVKHGDPIPGSVTLEELIAVKTAMRNQLMMAFTEKLQLGPGQLMREIGESMTQRTVCDGVPSLYLYSGHDATIMSVAANLGVPVNEWPDYTANIIVELLKSADLREQYFVRVLYNGAEVRLTSLSSPTQESKTVFTIKEFLEQFSLNRITEEEFQSTRSKTEDSSFYDNLRRVGA
ncbi:hypothetical protein AXG93_4689s1600 [Marchantia polymorpha subsp. ruderalis]|uniref:Acid phosphatase n=1 Tax=Marchantia polymorpha subsp. ruderalis TaxID=1480154 RepID=A0A176WM33_MARPO|nr:hypothetical protein AXG93_4689s1600 [Marchantia polymorpha subsp. ruderalis]